MGIARKEPAGFYPSGCATEPRAQRGKRQLWWRGVSLHAASWIVIEQVHIPSDATFGCSGNNRSHLSQ